VDAVAGDAGAPDAQPFVCQTQADCDGVPSCGEWNTCSGFSGACDETGEQQQVCNSYVCSPAGICVVSESRVEKRGCTRDQDGAECGAKSCGAFTECGGFESSCDQEGTRSQSCNVDVCQDGQCVPVVRDEVSACARNTNANSCGEDCVATGACAWEGDPECDETGAQPASCTLKFCVNGTCAASNMVVDRMLDCPRPTEGMGCRVDAPVCSDSCPYPTFCSESVQGTRTCTPYKCASSACVLNPAGATQQSIPCSRSTQDLVCENDGCPFNYIGTGRKHCCTGGSCNTAEYCDLDCEPSGNPR
jgi:hypothetical protein